MSKLQELIDQYCPNGVPFKKLDEILDYEQPTQYIVKSTKYDDSYKTPVLTAGQTFILGYTNEDSGIYKADKIAPTIIFDDFTTSFHWVDFDFKVKSSAMKMLRPKSTFDGSFRYVFYAMECINFEAVNHTRHWISKYSQIEIPLPPPPIQEEIVKILDRFAEYAAELQAELQARQEQYEYYRDKLLSFNNINGGGCARVTWMKMNEILYSIRTGLNPRQFFKLNTPDAHSYYVTIREFNGGRLVFSDSTDRINESARMLCNNRSNLEINDVLFSGTGTIGETFVIDSTPLNWNIKEGVYALKPKLHIIYPKYLKYILSQSEIKSDYIKLAEGGTVKSISMKKLNVFSIPVPTLSEQERIINILDKFEALTSDLSQGLPAEIAAVQEQYEYYRDKLLSFPKYKLSA